MPTPQMFTNIEVLKQARKNFNRKVALAQQGTGKVPKPVVRDERGNIIRTPFDDRHPTDIASLIIDTKGIPEDKMEEYFVEEARKIASAFFALDEKTNKPDPEAIKPYVDMVFKKMTCDTNINWNSVEEVEKLLATQKASQSFVTLLEDFPDLIMDLYPTLDQIAWYDNFTGMATLLSNQIHNVLACIPDPDARLAVQRQETVEERLQYEVTYPVFEARTKGSHDIYLDAVASDFTKKFFLEQDFEEMADDYLLTSDAYSKRYLENFAIAYRNAGVEQQIDLAISKAFGDNAIEFDRLLINGKPIKDSINELEENENLTHFAAMSAAGKILRDALTDGKSVVTLMQVVTGAGGVTKFNHQEVKVNLDQLNDVDKKEGNYSLFRRFLDLVHIWKIQKYKTNDERDKSQTVTKNDDAFKQALRAAEDKFITQYNSDIVQKSLAERNPALAETFPKIVRAEEFEQNKQIGNEPERIQITDIKLEVKNELDVAPKLDDTKTLSSGQKTM